MLAIDPSLSVSDLLTGLTPQVAPFPTQFSGVTQACSASNRGNCICTTQTCGSGVLDAQAAVQWAMARADAHPGAAPFPASGQPATFLGVVTPSTSIDTTSGNGGGGGGGGALDFGDLGLLGLLGLAAALGGVSKGGGARKPRSAAQAQGRQDVKPLP
jgi:serine protease